MSLTVASTRFCFSRVMAWVKPSTDSTSAPASLATLAQLDVRLCADFLPLRSASEETEESSARVAMTPSETV